MTDRLAAPSEATSTASSERLACEGMEEWLMKQVRPFRWLSINFTDASGRECPAAATYRVRMRCGQGHSHTRLLCDEHAEWATRGRIMCPTWKCKDARPMRVVLREPIRGTS